MTKIKICGISRDVDTEYINEINPDFTGFIIGVPFSKRNIDHETAARLKSRLNVNIPTVGVFIDYPTERVAQLCNDGIIDIVQLHGSEDEDYIARLRSLVPKKLTIWKAFVVKTRQDVQNAENSSADMILLDSGTGSGRLLDWSIVSNVKRDFILAGGLTPENIADAVSQVKPWAVDISSGVETDGVKDKEKMEKAVSAVRGCFDERH